MAFYCNHCGAALPEGARFCNRCGSAAAQPAPNPMPAEGALFDTYSVPAPKRRHGLAIALAALALAVCVGLGFLLLNSLGTDSATTHSDEAEVTLLQMLACVTAEDPVGMFRTFYEFRSYTDEEISDYAADDRAEFGYTSDAQQVDDWFDVFVWRYCPDTVTLHTGVNSADLVSLTLSDADPIDGAYVTARAVVRVDGKDVENEELTLTFSMVREEGVWYVVNYDNAIAYELLGDEALTKEDCEYMVKDLFSYANSTNSTDLLYYFYDLYIDSYDNNLAYIDGLLAQSGAAEEAFCNRLVNRFLYLSGYSKDGTVPAGTAFEVLSFSMEDIPADYQEEDFLQATAEIRVTYADGSTETAAIGFEVTYYYGYWLAVLGES